MEWSEYTDYLIGRRLGPPTRRRYLRWVVDAEEWLNERGSNLAAASATEIAVWAEERVLDTHSCRGQAAAGLRHYWDMIGRYQAPSRAVPVPPAPEMVCRAIDDAAITRVVATALGWWPEGTAVIVGMGLALRRFEIAKMEWRRFTDDMAWYTVTGKYSKTAILPVHPTVAGELTGRRTTSPYVFPGRFGGPVIPATVWDWTKKVGRAAGVGNLVPHELRHTALAVANDNTQDLRSVQTFARHAKASTTSGYTRTTARRLREVSDALDYL